jgi:hypothetical protein
MIYESQVPKISFDVAEIAKARREDSIDKFYGRTSDE